MTERKEGGIETAPPPRIRCNQLLASAATVRPATVGQLAELGHAVDLQQRYCCVTCSISVWPRVYREVEQEGVWHQMGWAVWYGEVLRRVRMEAS